MALFLIALLWSPLAWGQDGCYDAGTVCKWKTVGLAKVPVLSHPSDSQIVVSRHLTSLAGTRFPTHVEQAIDSLGRANSLHVKASVTYVSNETGNRPLAGVYEYWEYSDERTVPLSIPNPFFLALQPLSVSSPDCPLCGLRLSDLHALQALRSSTSWLDSSVQASASAGERVEESLTPGGLLASVTLIRNQGTVLERADFSDHHAVGAAANQFPRLVTFKSTVNESGSVSHLAVTYRIEDLQLDGAIDDSVFSLDPSAFDRVWASDRRVFLKNLPSNCKKKK